MKSKFAPTMLGLFVFSAISLAIIILLYFVSEDILQMSREYVVFFPGSLKGLKVGSPVMYRGIKVGQVDRIEVDVNPFTYKIKIPVYFRFFKGRAYDVKSDHMVRIMIRRGLSAELDSINFLTGEVGIELIEHPEAPREKIKYYNEAVIIPVETSKATKKSLGEVLLSADKAFNTFKQFMKSPELESAVDTAKGAFLDTRTFVNNANKQIDPLANQLDETLAELQRTSRSLRVLTDYLSRHPEALIKGKGRSH